MKPAYPIKNRLAADMLSKLWRPDAPDFVDSKLTDAWSCRCSIDKQSYFVRRKLRTG